MTVVARLHVCLNFHFSGCSTSVKPSADAETGGKGTPDSPDIPTADTHIGTSNPNLKQGNSERKVTYSSMHLLSPYVSFIALDVFPAVVCTHTTCGEDLCLALTMRRARD